MDCQSRESKISQKAIEIPEQMEHMILVGLVHHVYQALSEEVTSTGQGVRRRISTGVDIS